MGLPKPPPDSSSATDVAASGSPKGSGKLVAPAAALQQDNKLDHRLVGQWKSRYGKAAWCQIAIEFTYLVAVLIACMIALVWLGYHVAPPTPMDVRAVSFFGIPFEYPRDRTFLLWTGIALSGTVGGCCFALKWLYHSVAKGLWNQDRILWRLIVPILSGAVSVFVSLLVASGLLSLIDTRFFASFYGAIGTGWLVGYFSDNVLASLQKLAHKWFGTVDDPKGSAGTTPEPGRGGT